MINSTGGFHPAIRVEPTQGRKPAVQLDAEPGEQQDAPRYRIDPAMDFPVLIEDDKTEAPASSKN